MPNVTKPEYQNVCQELQEATNEMVFKDEEPKRLKQSSRDEAQGWDVKPYASGTPVKVEKRENMPTENSAQGTLNAIKRLEEEIIALKEERGKARNMEEDEPRFLKMKTPESFDGKTPSAQSWFESVGNYWEYYADVSEIRKIILTGGFLKGDALTWWQANRQKHTSYEGLLNALKRFYLPENMTQKARYNLERLKQTSSVEDYTTKFNHLVLQIDDLSFPEKKNRYFSGLLPKIRRELIRGLRKYKDLAQIQTDAADIALTYEVEEDTVQGIPPGIGLNAMGTGQRRLANPKYLGRLTPELKKLLIAENRCFFCRFRGHSIGDCRLKKAAAARRSNTEAGQGNGSRQGE